MKARLYYFNKETHCRDERAFDRVYRDLNYVTRGNDPSKVIAGNALTLLTNLVSMLKSSPYKQICINQDLLYDITSKETDQNNNLLKQLGDIVIYKYHRTVRFEGRRYNYCYIVEFTKDGEKRVSNPELFYAIDGQKKSVRRGKKFGHQTEKIRPSNIREIKREEREKEPLGSSFSLSPSYCSSSKKIRAREESKNAPCANGSFNEPAQDDFSYHETEPDKSTETPQSVTVCNQLNKQQYPRLLTAKEEKERHLQRMQRNHANEEESSFAELMSRVLNILPAEQTTQEPNGTDPTLAGSSKEPLAKVLITADHPLTTESETAMKQEKITEITNEQSSKMLLSKAIFNAFGEHAANEIQDNCEFMFLKPDKLSIKVKQGVILEEHEKAKLRACIRSVYGENVKIVADAYKSQTMSVPELRVVANNNDAGTNPRVAVSVFPSSGLSANWAKFRAKLLERFNARYEAKYSEHIVKNWYDRLCISNDSSQDRLVLVGDGYVIDRINQDYFSQTEEAVFRSGIDVELHYEANRQKPIVISRTKICK
jgi:hypothetical protein